ncbi:PucR family transcriptional regulator ligand-binding domain-containing protein [Pseudonocardia sp. KRD291]|uniref:helix-turn-helix domain-containing protein n=1 Tax=Pseudonocardia sp. KRD291 TaxID=2792007 RepID=UPI001C4A242B|nr:helix-turn-helix domain-containing protein [Pseudonocardia sp. KRD291]MBW0102860.1 PucR family transcriptional regulator ligand-binding domain-containing protein [Pseudonocardia sp. KRD291]
MLLRDLVTRPDLGLRVLHAGDGALDHAVRWVYTTDLIDPGRYLGGGELVVSGLVWRRADGDAERFVAAVAAAGATALAAGEAVFGEIPADVVAACLRHDLVLLAVPEDVSFAALTEVVIGELTAARGDRLAHTLGRQRQLLSAVAGGVGLDELAGQVSAATGLTCRVLSASGRAVAGPPLPDDERDAAVATYLTAERLPAVAGRHSVFPVGPGTSRLTSWFVAVHGTVTDWDSEVADTVGELAAIAALDRARLREGMQVARGIADDAVARIAAGEGDRAETRVRLRQAGVDPDAGLTVLVARLSGGPDPAGTARSILIDAVAPVGPAAVGVHDGSAVALVPAPAGPSPGPAGAAPARPSELLAPVLDALRRLAPGLGTLRLHVGAGRPAGPEALSGSLREATHARDLAAARPDPVSVAGAGEVTSHVGLLASVPDEVRRAFAAHVLGPVLDYDARTGAGLCETLVAFLDQAGSWSRTAARLHLHVNTVRYRIGRVEELTGRSMGHFPDRVDLYLALRSR